MENVYLIVGLGNPGKEYAKTRHNAGFLLVENLAERWRADWRAEKKFQSRVAKVERSERRIFLCEPQTFMNASGEAVSAVTTFYRVPLKNLLVVVDDADLPLGTIRLRGNGSSGGHHGLESIEQYLSSRDFARLRIGIGRNEGAREITNYVLGKFVAEEKRFMEKVLATGMGQVECWIENGIEKAMNQFNGTVKTENKT